MNTLEVKIPDIGDFKDIPVIEVLVKPGDSVERESPLLTLESDKATLEVPSPAAGRVVEVRARVGDRVSKGALVLTLDAAALPRAAAPDAGESARREAVPARSEGTPAPALAEVMPAVKEDNDASAAVFAYASPAVRRLARELGVDLSKVTGTGPKKRLLKEDVQNHVKRELSRPRAGGGGFPTLAPMPGVDFSKFGTVEQRPLSRIRKISGTNLHRNWVSIPHITHHDEIDITELEAFRRTQSGALEKDGIRLTLLAFALKAVAVALRRFETFNASLSPDGESLILKRYCHIGVAVDTPGGLVVPVIRDVNGKGLVDLARELSAVSARMREGRINPADLQGGCFSVSSLGGIGGSLFTPIINAPEVAILGIGRAMQKPVWRGGFVPRLMLPVSLSYDHRVIDGAEGARFITFLGEVLSDIRRLML